MIPAPHADLVPCSETCRHQDCMSARTVAYTACVRCQRPIGYDRPYRRLSAGFALLEHQHCPPSPRHDALCVDEDGTVECCCGLNDSPYPGDPR